MRYSFVVRTRALLLLCSATGLGACSPSRSGHEEITPVSDIRQGIRFDNQGRDRVDVYLVGETRAWRIGRLDPGQARWLTVPSDIPTTDLARLQLAVVANASVLVDPRRDPSAITSLKQPVGSLMGQRWGYVFGQLTTARPGAVLEGPKK